MNNKTYDIATELTSNGLIIDPNTIRRIFGEIAMQTGNEVGLSNIQGYLKKKAIDGTDYYFYENSSVKERIHCQINRQNASFFITVWDNAICDFDGEFRNEDGYYTFNLSGSILEDSEDLNKIIDEKAFESVITETGRRHIVDGKEMSYEDLEEEYRGMRKKRGTVNNIMTFSYYSMEDVISIKKYLAEHNCTNNTRRAGISEWGSTSEPSAILLTYRDAAEKIGISPKYKFSIFCEEMAPEVISKILISPLGTFDEYLKLSQASVKK